MIWRPAHLGPSVKYPFCDDLQNCTRIWGKVRAGRYLPSRLCELRPERRCVVSPCREYVTNVREVSGFENNSWGWLVYPPSGVSQRTGRLLRPIPRARVSKAGDYIHGRSPDVLSEPSLWSYGRSYSVHGEACIYGNSGLTPRSRIEGATVTPLRYEQDVGGCDPGVQRPNGFPVSERCVSSHSRFR